MPTVSESSSKHLPSEILIEILSRLPVKTLTRFNSVCKSWYCLIKDPSFVTKQLNHSSSYNTDNLLIVPAKLKLSRPNFYLLFSEESFFEYWKSEFPLLAKSGTTEVVGSCNRLLCLTDRYEHTFGREVYLWNPAIRRCKALWPTRLCWKKTYVVLGFGFQGTVSDFKVVRIVYHYNFGCESPVLPEVEVYSLRTDLWRSINVNVPCRACHSSMAFVGGAVHWIADGEETCEPYSTIMSFNLSDETFGEIMLPNDVKYRLDIDLFVMGFEGLLHLFIFSRIPSLYSRESRCEICIMEEYGLAESWIKYFNVKSVENITRPLCFANKRRLIILETNEGKQILCGLGNLLSSGSPDDQQSGCYIICNGRYAISAGFVESLVLFDEVNRYAIK